MRLPWRRSIDPAERLRAQREEVGPNGWTCHICGDYRPDERISVHTTTRDLYIRPIRLPGDVTVQARQNVRYCNDRDACIARARGEAAEA